MGHEVPRPFRINVAIRPDAWTGTSKPEGGNLVEEIVNLFTSNGMAVAIIIYFLYKDYKFNDLILSVLTEIKEVLAALKTVHTEGAEE